MSREPFEAMPDVMDVKQLAEALQISKAGAYNLLNSPDFAAGIFGEKLVKPVFYSGNIAVCAIGVDGVKVVVDGDIPHIVFRESEVDIKPGQRGISTQSG